jgi:hypothetical protein
MIWVEKCVHCDMDRWATPVTTGKPCRACELANSEPAPTWDEDNFRPRLERPDTIDLLNERLYLRATVYRLWRALCEIDGEAMTLLAGRTDAWPLIDAVEKAHAAWAQLVEAYPEMLDDDLMLRTCGCMLDARKTAKGLSCDHPEHSDD